MTRFLAFILAACFFLGLVQAGGSGTGLHLRHPLTEDLKDNETIVVDGKVESSDRATLVVRIDDAASRDYASRANIERSLPPGAFHWEIGARGLRTSSGRPLDLKTVRELLLFTTGNGKVSIAAVKIKSFSPLAPGALAYSFGESDAPLLEGFERIGPENSMIVAGHANAVRRPGPDPLVASGIAGVEKIQVAWPQPGAHVTLWTEDPGDWELLPHPLERRIRVNGADVVYERFTRDEWLDKRYLRGLRDEHSDEDDAWTAYGRKRGGLLSFETPIGANGIVIELAGDSPSATFLNAIVVEPAGRTIARDEAEARRAAWYRNTWPVVRSADSSHLEDAVNPLRATAASGTGVRLLASFMSGTAAIEHPQITIASPKLGGMSLDVRIWASQRLLERHGASDTTLTHAGNLLRSDISALPIAGGKSRSYELWISIPQGAQPGVYRGAVILGEAKTPQRPIEIEVLPAILPEVVKPAGFYLDESPQWSWFYGFNLHREEQLACDLKLLESLGITGNAPALSTPLGEGKQAFISDMELAAAGRVANPWLAYAAQKRVLERVGAGETAAVLREAEDRIRNAGLTPPVWSIADEPSNAQSRGVDLKAWIDALRKGVPRVRLAAQLNAPADKALASSFDVGREGDVQMIFPAAEACPAQPSIHSDLLAMAEGFVDQRWLLWLAAQRGTEAEALVAKLKDRFGGHFANVADLTERDLDEMRASIIDLALKTRLSQQ